MLTEPDKLLEDIEQPAEMQAEAPVQPAAKAAPAPAPSKKKFVSWGTRIHNEITYRGIDWLINSAIGVSFTYWSARTDMGKKWFQTPVSNFFKKILSPILKTEAAQKEGALWGSRFISIMAGGTVIMPAIMIMEYKSIKKSLIQWLDKKIYGKEKIESDPKFAESYKQIDEEPKKGFWIGNAARYISLAILLVPVSIPKTNKHLKRFIYDPIASVTTKAADLLNIKATKLKDKFEMVPKGGDANAPLVKQTNWEFIHETIGFDFGITFFYAFLHEAMYKAFAAMGMKKFDTPEKAKAADGNGAAAPQNAVEASASPASEPTKSWVSELATHPKAAPEKSASFSDSVDKSRESGALQLAGA